MPIMPSDCVDSARPIDDGRKFNSAIAACTRASASAETGPRPEIARDAVDMPTPARTATSFRVATGAGTPWGWVSFALGGGVGWRLVVGRSLVGFSRVLG